MTIYNSKHTQHTKLIFLFSKTIVVEILGIHFNQCCRANLGRSGWKRLFSCFRLLFSNCLQTLSKAIVDAERNRRILEKQANRFPWFGGVASSKATKQVPKTVSSVLISNQLNAEINAK